MPQPRFPLLFALSALALTACGGPTTPLLPNVITDAHVSRNVILVGQTSTVSATASSGVVHYEVAPESTDKCHLINNQQVTARVPTTCVITVTGQGTWYMDGRRYVEAAPQQLTVTVERGLLIDTVAGTGVDGSGGDGGPAVEAQIGAQMALATDADGRIYIASTDARRIRRIDPSGIITTVAGNGTFGSSVDGTLAVDAPLGSVTGVAVDAAGTLYFADASVSRVRKIDAQGIIVTVAGSGPRGALQDGLPATQAYINTPEAIAFGPDGTLYIAERGPDRVRKVDANGLITTVAGTGTAGFSGDGGPAVQAQLDHPTGLAVNAAGTVYIADYNNRRVRAVDTSGTIRTVAGTGELEDPAVEAGPALQTAVSPTALTLDSSGALYMTAFNSSRVRRLGLDGTVVTVAGGYGTGFHGDGGPATLALLSSSTALATLPDGRLLVGDAGNRRVRALTP